MEEEQQARDFGWVAQAIPEHRKVMVRECVKILGNRWDAEEAVSVAVVKLMTNPPGKPVENPRAWLCTVARHAAIDWLLLPQKRHEVPDGRDHEPGGPAVGDPRDWRIRFDVGRFRDRVLAMVPEPRRDDVELYFEVHRGLGTVTEQAIRSGVPEHDIRRRHRRARTALRRAAPVAALVTDPGDGPDRCPVPFSLARELPDSPALVRKVETHVRGCAKCARRKSDRNGLRGIVLVTTGVVLGGGLLTSKVTKAAVAVGATAAVVLVVIFGPGSSGSGPEQPPPPQPVPVRAPSVAAPSSPPEPPAPAATAPAGVPHAAPAAAEPAPSGSGAAAREVPLTVTGSWVEHRRIVTGEHGCEDEPHSSGVRVTVSPAAASAVILLTAGGFTTSLPMQGAGTEWSGEIGRVPNEDAAGRLGVAVRVVGTSGAETVAQLGEIRLDTCRSGG
ncbi:RNA polymerase sigma factor [Amycolatopsis kentuckyensis]|uniref:RNA polymerase sigma factor n=1 Tax=Amycolatopsis kentuckyensis TaxID=218823 RepID=UPI0035637523